MTNEREIIAIPMGDAAGVGPEITIKSLAKEEMDDVETFSNWRCSILSKAISIDVTELNIN